MFGEDQETAIMAANSTREPLLDARMVEEETLRQYRGRVRGLMSQKDKRWIINIQLNQLKCDNVDDYYFNIYQAR